MRWSSGYTRGAPYFKAKQKASLRLSVQLPALRIFSSSLLSTPHFFLEMAMSFAQCMPHFDFISFPSYSICPILPRIEKKGSVISK